MILLAVVQTVSVGCISRSRGQEIGFQNAFKKIFFKTSRPRAFSTLIVKMMPLGMASP